MASYCEDDMNLTQTIDLYFGCVPEVAESHGTKCGRPRIDHYSKGRKDAEKLNDKIKSNPTGYDYKIKDKARSYELRHKDKYGFDPNAGPEYQHGMEDHLMESYAKYAAFEHNPSGKYPGEAAKSPHFDSESKARHWIEDHGSVHVIRRVYR
jgi:hypothetical protein